MKKSLIIILSVVIGLILIYQLVVNADQQVNFNEDIRPILNEHCLSCHGGVKQQGDLSFLFEETALLPARSGKYAIIPGNTKESELVNRIRHSDTNLRMPFDADPLPEDQIQLVEKWIEQGAKWDEHWAYIAPSPDVSVPNMSGNWANNNIDHFVSAKLGEVGLQPAEEAEKTQMIRRVSLDLVGLPPTIQDVETFINDDRPEAYEALVDKLLASTHYGEKWASMWLDLARYADSRGYQKDLLRPDIWRYRDWVIDAFNQDMPFDQFTIEQLAGDMIPDHTDNQLLATAFHRNTMTNDEGGTDDEEFRVAAVIDRLNTTMEIWQGTTIGCVQCHSHPYDPIKHEEFYGLMAFFNNTMDQDDYSDSPTSVLLSPIQAQKRAAIEQQLMKLEDDGQKVSEEYQKLVEQFRDQQKGSVPIMQELPADTIRPTHIFERGNWLVHGDQVSPDVPNTLPPIKGHYEQNRLGLAKWLVADENPLTSRVMVNRIWEQIFGQGIVTTLEDFGTQGDKPSHPNLLDWLATEYQHTHQWSTKTLLKQIVMSATYRQSSNFTAKKLEIDPKNRYLSRGPRFRLSAEQIRDQALAVSGLLNREIYGKSVMPHQPEGVWNVIRHAAKWEKAKDGNQHRRGVYTFWRRVSPYPSMISFDVPSRELCVSRRIKTNTPLQALITLNDPVYVEAAESLASLMMNNNDDDVRSQIDFGFRQVLHRSAGDAVLTELTKLYDATYDTYKSDTELTEDPHKFSMIQIASVLLNLDEVIMKT